MRSPQNLLLSRLSIPSCPSPSPGEVPQSPYQLGGSSMFSSCLEHQNCAEPSRWGVTRAEQWDNPLPPCSPCWGLSQGQGGFSGLERDAFPSCYNFSAPVGRSLSDSLSPSKILPRSCRAAGITALCLHPTLRDFLVFPSISPHS